MWQPRSTDIERAAGTHRTRALVALAVGGLLVGAGAAPSGATPAPVRSGLVATTAEAPTVCASFVAPEACYEFNDVDSTMVDSTTPATNLQQATGGSDRGVRRVVASDGTASEYFFSGWKGHTSTEEGTLGELMSEDALPRAYGQAVVDLKGASGESFNPDGGTWRIATRIRPSLIRIAGAAGMQLPTPSRCTDGCGAAAPSYNVVQKGRSGPIAGGYYKVEIMGYDGGGGQRAFRKGSVHCVFRDADGTTVEAFSGQPASGASGVRLDKHRYYAIDCLRSGSSVTLRVTEEGASGPRTETVQGQRTVWGSPSATCRCSAGGLDAVSPLNGGEGASAYSSLFSIGKKPQSTQIEDAFAGWIDYVVLARG